MAKACLLSNLVQGVSVHVSSLDFSLYFWEGLDFNQKTGNGGWGRLGGGNLACEGQAQGTCSYLHTSAEGPDCLVSPGVLGVVGGSAETRRKSSKPGCGVTEQGIR